MKPVKPEVNFKYSEYIFRDVYCESQNQKRWSNYRRNWYEVPKNGIVTDFPMHLDLEVTNVCDLRCPMCPRTQMLQQGTTLEPKYMKFETFRKTIDLAKGKALYAINLNASGEPLFNNDLARMIKYAKQKGILDIMFHTNATLLDQRTSEELMASGVNRLIVSFDSPIKEHYERIRQGACFEEVVTNIKRFIFMRNRMGKMLPHVRINMVVMKENYNEQDMMIDFWKDYVDSVGFLQYVNCFHMDNMDRGIETEKGIYDENFVCEKLWQRLAISEEGGIKLCHMDDRGKVFLGDIEKDDISQIWCGEEMNNYRRLHLEGKIRDIQLCADCGVPIR